MEIENVTYQIKELFGEWQKGLLGLQKRNKAYKAVMDLVDAKRNSVDQQRSILEGIRLELNHQHEISENLTFAQQKLEQQQQAQMRKNGEFDMTIEKLSQHRSILIHSLKLTEEQNKQMDLETAQIEDQMATMEKHIMKLHTDTKAEMERIMDHLSEKTTIEKSSTNLIKQTKEAYTTIFEKESEVENIQNEIGRVNIDVLNTNSQNGLLNTKKKELIAELEKMGKKEEKALQKIKEYNDRIKRKQDKVNELNKTYDREKNKSIGDSDLSPLQNEIINLMKEV
jgi:chromosome segregation ATPase